MRVHLSASGCGAPINPRCAHLTLALPQAKYEAALAAPTAKQRERLLVQELEPHEFSRLRTLKPDCELVKDAGREAMRVRVGVTKTGRPAGG